MANERYLEAAEIRVARDLIKRLRDAFKTASKLLKEEKLEYKLSGRSKELKVKKIEEIELIRLLREFKAVFYDLIKLFYIELRETKLEKREKLHIQEAYQRIIINELKDLIRELYILVREEGRI